MALYEYEYVNAEGQPKRVERRFKMGEAPAEILVQEGDEQYRAMRVLSVPAAMKTNWGSWYDPSDLPPVDSPIIE